MEYIVDRNTAESEITAWLDAKKVGRAKRESNKAFVDLLISAVEEGYLTRNDSTNELTLNLRFPRQGSDGVITLDKLVFKPRASASELKPFNDRAGQSIDGRYIAIAQCLTGKDINTISNLDSEDMGVVQAIAIFFL